MAALIDSGTLEGLIELDESAMPSTAVVHFKTTVTNDRGGSSSSTWANRNVTPIKCRVVPGGVRNRVTGEQLQTVGDVTLQLALSGLAAQGVVIEATDEITATTTLTLPNGNSVLVAVDRYKVVGAPSVGSYSTNLGVPCVKVS